LSTSDTTIEFTASDKPGDRPWRRAGKSGIIRVGPDPGVRPMPADGMDDTAGTGGGRMASMIGDHGNFWLVAVLLMLALGLAGALFKATRAGSAAQIRGRRPR
jgi:hypothetical protein